MRVILSVQEFKDYLKTLLKVDLNVDEEVLWTDGNNDDWKLLISNNNHTLYKKNEFGYGWYCPTLKEWEIMSFTKFPIYVFD